MSTAIAGCVATPEAYAKRQANLGCKHTEECQAEVFEMLYDGDQKTCREKGTDAINELHAMFEDQGCEYQSKYARKCLSAARKEVGECNNDQEQSNEDCRKVWDCPAGPNGEQQKMEEELDQLRAQVEDELVYIDPWTAAIYGLEQ